MTFKISLLMNAKVAVHKNLALEIPSSPFTVQFSKQREIRIKIFNLHIYLIERKQKNIFYIEISLLFGPITVDL